MSSQQWKDLSQEAGEIWEKNAAFWDDFMGEGNQFQRFLIAPIVERLLDLKPGDRVLEAACGNGNFARRLADLGAQVEAFDISETFVARARVHSAAYHDRIDYHVIDAGNPQALRTFGQHRFDAATCNMALMDLPDIDPLLEALARALKPGGRFVFTVMHPCFNSVGTTKLLEVEDRAGEIVNHLAIKVFDYIQPVAQKGLGVVGQPEAQYYFHRPISVLLGHCFQAGFVLDAFEEPVFDDRVEQRDFHRLSWNQFREIPPVMVARLRMIG